MDQKLIKLLAVYLTQIRKTVALLELLQVNVQQKDVVGHLLVRTVLPHGAFIVLPPPLAL
jgi:hypothetical protein